jgi:hypothetical protein
MSKKEFKKFLNSIPAAKLENFPNGQGTLYPKPIKDGHNFRLDKQNEGVRKTFSFGGL